VLYSNRDEDRLIANFLKPVKTTRSWLLTGNHKKRRIIMSYKVIPFSSSLIKKQAIVAVEKCNDLSAAYGLVQSPVGLKKSWLR